MWNEIETDKEIEDFLNITYSLHDSVVVSVNYQSGNDKNKSGGIHFSPYDKHTLSLVIYSSWSGYIEMLFGGVRKFSVTCFDDFYLHEIISCYLKFHTDLYGKRRDDRLIVWADGHFEPLEKTSVSLNEKSSTYIIAETLKWRYVED